VLSFLRELQVEEPNGNGEAPTDETASALDFLKKLFEAKALEREKAHQRDITNVTWSAGIRRLNLELSRVQTLRAEMEKELADIRLMKATFAGFQPRVVMIRELNENEAEQEIVTYLQSHDHADTGELVEKLGIDVDAVLNVVQRLKEQGRVERVDSHESKRRD